MTARRPSRRRLLFALLTPLLLLGTAELAARLVLPEQRFILNPVHATLRDDALLFWSMPPDMERQQDGIRVKTNALGLRDGPVELPKPAGQVRILSLGESTTWGHGVAPEQTYSAQLEALLNADTGAGAGETSSEGKRYRVINAGVGACTIFQSYLYLVNRGGRLAPDMVLLYHEINDFSPATGWDRNNFMLDVSVTDRQRHEARQGFIWILSALYHSRLYLWARNTLLVKRYRRDRPSDHDRQRPRGSVRVPRQDRLFVLERIHEFCRERGISLVVVHPIYLSDVEQCDSEGGCLLRTFAKKRGLPLVELRTVLAEEARGRKGFFLDGCHPTASGHQRIAEELHRFLRERKLVRGTE